VSRSLVYKPTAAQVSRTLIDSGAYLTAPSLANRSTWYTWKSGVVAPVYCDCRKLGPDAGATALIRVALGNAIRLYYPEAEVIVGMAEAGVIWSTLAASELAKGHAFVRKQRKTHGTRTLVECNPPKRAKAVIVDDLVASGGSIEHAYRAITGEAGMNVVGVMSIVNWDFEQMHRTLARLGLTVHSLTSYPELLDAAVELGRLTEAAAFELRVFYGNPQGHEWDLRALRAQGPRQNVA
jgi:orotate phosphoribosyltransferase